MLILKGTLRQRASMTIKEKSLIKLWVEHETPREGGVKDLKIEEFFLDPDNKIPPDGSQIDVVVRPYVSGTRIAFSAVGIFQPKNG